MRNFEDAIQQDYAVTTTSPAIIKMFSQEDPGSAKHEVWKRNWQGDWSDLWESNEAWFRSIATEEKLLGFTVGIALAAYKAAEPYQRQLFNIKMDEKYYDSGTLALTKDSEFLPMFNYYILKAYETGIMMKLHRDHHSVLFTNQHFGMTEPQPLGTKNVMFLFIGLGFMIFLSCLIALVENLNKKLFGRDVSSSAWSATHMPGRSDAIKSLHVASQPQDDSQPTSGI